MNLISEESLRTMHEESCYLRKTLDGDDVAGFLLALSEGARYDSLNYRWFAEHPQPGIHALS